MTLFTVFLITTKKEPTLKNYQLIFCLMAAVPSLSFALGSLENPVAGSTESGIGVISGWHCTATNITATIDGASLGKAGSGTGRGDTASICGRTNTGYSLLFNYNDLTPGNHSISVYADGQLLETRQFNTVQSGGAAFLTGKVSRWTLAGFPSSGRTATIEWSQAKQNFVVTGISGNDTTPPPVTVSVQAAMANLINNGYSKTYTLTGWIDNSTIANPVPHTPITGSGTLTVGSPTTVNFVSGPLAGTHALQSVGVWTGAATGTTYTYYNTSNYTTVATFDGTNTIYYSPYSNPDTVHAGSAGSLGSGSDGKLFATNVTTAYAVASDTNTTLLVTLMETVLSPGGGKTQTQTVYRIDTSGGASLVSATVQFIRGSSVYKSLTYTF